MTDPRIIQAITERGVAEAVSALAEQKERFVKDSVTFKFTQRVGVDVRKPRWMPTFVWKWMWRRVIIYESEPTIR